MCVNVIAIGKKICFSDVLRSVEHGKLGPRVVWCKHVRGAL